MNCGSDRELSENQVAFFFQGARSTSHFFTHPAPLICPVCLAAQACKKKFKLLPSSNNSTSGRLQASYTVDFKSVGGSLEVRQRWSSESDFAFLVGWVIRKCESWYFFHRKNCGASSAVQSSDKKHRVPPEERAIEFNHPDNLILAFNLSKAVIDVSKALKSLGDWTSGHGCEFAPGSRAYVMRRSGVESTIERSCIDGKAEDAEWVDHFRHICQTTYPPKPLSSRDYCVVMLGRWWRNAA